MFEESILGTKRILKLLNSIQMRLGEGRKLPPALCIKLLYLPLPGGEDTLDHSHIPIK